MESETLGAVGNNEFGVFNMFLGASLTVQIVMIILVIASIWAWAIVINKLRLYRSVKADAQEFEEEFWSGRALDEIYQDIGKNPSGDMEHIFAAGMNEWRKSHFKDGEVMAGANARIERAMNVSINNSRETWEKGLTVLATVGSTAPFIGLFGTVWGIKTAFQEIAMSQSTNLAIVAPGIAEALIATALGLVAAIPAVIFYNKLSNDEERLATDHENFADEFALILSRQIDQERA